MATVTTSKANGTRRIQFTDADAIRRTLYIGEASARQAANIAHHVAELNKAKRCNGTPPPATAAWLEGVGDDLRRKLAAVGLIEDREREDVTLGGFTTVWESWKSATVKPSTMTRLRQATRLLIEYFGADRKLATITPGDADDWRAWMLGKRSFILAEATVRKRTADARDLIAYATRKGAFVGVNPFGHLAASATTNLDRRHYIDEPTAWRVLDALQGAGSVPTWELRLLFGLARWGGMRVPSEPAALCWSDINFDTGRIRVDSPKTGPRVLPLFPELRPLLMDAFEQTEAGEVRVLPSLQRLTATALRKHLIQGIRRAGLTEWPKLFVNLRSSRETDLADRFPLQAVVGWIGNSEIVAAKHYLQVTDDHFAAALVTTATTHLDDVKYDVTTTQNTTHAMHATTRDDIRDISEHADFAGENADVRIAAQPCFDTDLKSMARVGLEPT